MLYWEKFILKVYLVIFFILAHSGSKLGPEQCGIFGADTNMELDNPYMLFIG